MSHVADLLERLCPEGVSYQPLGEIGVFIRGGGLQKSDLTGSGFPAIHYGQIHTTYGTWARETASFVAPAFAERRRKASSGDLIIATTSEDDEAVGKAVAWLGGTDVAVSGDAYIFHHRLSPKYVSYFFQSEQFRSQKRSAITGTKVKRISGKALGKIRIPVPPLEVQEAIVGVLDLYESLDAELGAELEAERRARQHQYVHYRRALLTASHTKVRRSTLGAICTRYRLEQLHSRPGQITTTVISHGFERPKLLGRTSMKLR